MAESLPILVIIAAAVIGAAFMYFSFQRNGRLAGIGAVAGAVAGGIGALIFMVPLNFCMFEAERTALDVAIGILLIGIGMLIALLPARWLIRWRMQNAPSPFSDSLEQQGAFRTSPITPWLLLAPTLLILVFFLYYPWFDNFRLSTLLTGRGAPRSRFVCLDNFTSLIADPEYHYSVVITFVIAAAIVVIGLSLALLIATAAYQPIKGGRIYRTLLVWPYAISPVVAGVIFGLMFDPASGIINYFTDNLFGFKIPWLLDPKLAVISVIVTSVWKSMGFSILFYIAGLQNIPTDLQEAASIDGANRIQRFFRITVPLLSPITFFLVITTMTYSFFDIFGTIDYLTAGGPLNATTVMMYRIYETANTSLGLGSAAAQSIVIFLMVVGLTALQFRGAGRRVTYGA
jgi:sn-glycerol 3-phosphate transport system permease protein